MFHFVHFFLCWCGFLRQRGVREAVNSREGGVCRRSTISRLVIRDSAPYLCFHGRDVGALPKRVFFSDSGVGLLRRSGAQVL